MEMSPTFFFLFLRCRDLRFPCLFLPSRTAICHRHRGGPGAGFHCQDCWEWQQGFRELVGSTLFSSLNLF